MAFHKGKASLKLYPCSQQNTLACGNIVHVSNIDMALGKCTAFSQREECFPKPRRKQKNGKQGAKPFGDI